MKQPSEKLPKNPYQSPKLLVYGDLKEMTKSSGRFGKLDAHGRPLHNRTGGN
jgi:hypothetical protein